MSPGMNNMYTMEVGTELYTNIYKKILLEI